MTEEKRNRIVAAVTVNVILLIAILIAVCIYTLVAAVHLKNVKDSLTERIAYCNAQADKDRATLEYFQSYDGLVQKAHEYGFQKAP